MKEAITKETLERLKNGDHEAFERVFITYYNKIKFFIAGLVKSQSDGEELAQGVFVNLWESRETIDSDKSLGAYVYVIARNAAFNFLKGRNVRTSYAQDFTHTNEEGYSVELMFEKELKMLESAVVEHMPEQRRKIYQYSRWDGLQNDEIAEKLGISRKTVENQLSLALRELRKIIVLFCAIFS